MRHRKNKAILDRGSSQRKTLLRNLVISLVQYERITTTAAKARAVRSFMERLVTIGKANDLAAHRLLLSRLNNEKTAMKILKEISPRFKERPGGYTRSIRLSPRLGDASAQVIIEFVK